MEKNKIELNERPFVSTLNEPKLLTISEMMASGKCKYVDKLEDHYGIGDVFLFDVENGNTIDRVAYGEFGRVELSHIDLKTCQMTEPRYYYPTDSLDYAWLIGMAIFNRNYTKMGKNYLEYVEDATLSSIKNRKIKTPDDWNNNKKLCRKIAENFIEMKNFYEEAVNEIGDQTLQAERVKSHNPILICVKEYTNGDDE